MSCLQKNVYFLLIKMTYDVRYIQFIMSFRFDASVLNFCLVDLFIGANGISKARHLPLLYWG